MLRVRTLILCCLCVTIVLRVALKDVIQIELLPGPLGMTEFYLQDGERLVSNQASERPEQTSIMTYMQQSEFLQSEDRVVNMGANIGTTCITFEKLLRQTPRTHSHPVLACVEPNNLMQPILHDNFRLNDVTDIKLLDGLVADTPNCPEGVPVSRGEAQIAPGVEQFPQLSRLPRSMEYRYLHVMSFNISNCFTLQAIKEFLGNKMTVIYADCEGCLTDVFRLNREIFADPMIRLVMYERDGDYTEVEKGLVDLGFRRRDASFFGTAWQRGPPYATVRVWAIMMWSMFTIAAINVVDKLFLVLLKSSSVLPFYDTYVQVPVWRLLIVLFIIATEPYHLSRFGNAWVLYQGPSVFRSDWIDVYWRVGEGSITVRYLFVYPLVVWHLVIAMQKAFMPTRHVSPWVLSVGFLCMTGLIGCVMAAVRNELDKAYQPDKAIWEVTIAATVLLPIMMLLRARKLAGFVYVTPAP